MGQGQRGNASMSMARVETTKGCGHPATSMTKFAMGRIPKTSDQSIEKISHWKNYLEFSEPSVTNYFKYFHRNVEIQVQ
jgi:hypothetical protein